jgi:uncharacterized membrane-anchored protein
VLYVVGWIAKPTNAPAADRLIFLMNVNTPAVSSAAKKIVVV